MTDDVMCKVCLLRDPSEVEEIVRHGVYRLYMCELDLNLLVAGDFTQLAMRAANAKQKLMASRKR